MAEARPKPLRATPKIRKITVRMPKALKGELPARILADGYNMREKSKWVVESVLSLLAKRGWEGALLAEVVVRPDVQDVFSVPSEVAALINREARRIGIENPSLNANQSTIIRAAINRRLLGFYDLPR